MSLQHLFTSKSAQFFRVNPHRRLSNTAVAQLVRKVSGNKTGRFEERMIRESHTVDGSESYVTYCCFAIESEPSFLRDSGLRDTRYAYLLLIEAPEAIAVFRRNVEGVLQGLAPYVLPWKYDQLGGVFFDKDTAFERISLRNMSVASNVVRRRTLEAESLADSMAVAGIHRSIPNNFRTRGTAGTHTVAPGNARISRKDARAPIEELIRWVRQTGAALQVAEVNYPRTFLAEFCRAVPLAELPAGATPNAVLFDFSELREKWEDAPADHELLLARSPRADAGRILTQEQIIAFFRIASQVLTIEGDEIRYTSMQGKVHTVGRIRMNKNSISVRSGLLERMTIRSFGIETRLSTYANQESNFVVTFSEPEFGYAESQLFRDSALLGSIDSLLQIFEPHAELSAVTDEKAVSQREFEVNGIFRFVEDSLVDAGAFLVCDDLGDEWADYVAFDETLARPRLSFIHCKHGKRSTSASALQEPIGQAVKNLSRMFRPLEAFAAKIDGKWSTNYPNTEIARIRRGASADNVKRACSAIVSDPNTERVVLLVLSGLSLTELSDEFNALKNGNARPHVSQLLWILSGFLAACREHGVRAHITCQP